MVKFRYADLPKDCVKVELEQDEDDVNIVIDGITVAYLDAADGALCLLPILETADVEEDLEFATTVDEDGYPYIKVKKDW